VLLPEFVDREDRFGHFRSERFGILKRQRLQGFCKPCLVKRPKPSHKGTVHRNSSLSTKE